MFLKWSLKLRKVSVLWKVYCNILCEDESTMSSDVRLWRARLQPCRSNVLRHWLEQQYAMKLTVVLCEKTEKIYLLYNNMHL